MTNKQVARHIAASIDGVKRVDRYYNEDETKSIDIISIHTAKNIVYYSTVGAFAVDVGLSVNGKRLRIEVLSASYEETIIPNVLASIAFQIEDTGTCALGMVIPNVLRNYNRTADKEHVVLLSPSLWPDYHNLEDDEIIITWLYAVPISEREYRYIHQNGYEKFDYLLDKKGADVFNLGRPDITM